MKNRNHGRSMHTGRHDMEELRSHAEAVGRDVQELASAAGDMARHQLDPLADYVRTKPMKSLLIAAGVGAVLGVILGRR